MVGEIEQVEMQIAQAEADIARQEAALASSQREAQAYEPRVQLTKQQILQQGIAQRASVRSQEAQMQQAKIQALQQVAEQQQQYQQQVAPVRQSIAETRSQIQEAREWEQAQRFVDNATRTHNWMGVTYLPGGVQAKVREIEKQQSMAQVTFSKQISDLQAQGLKPIVSPSNVLTGFQTPSGEVLSPDAYNKYVTDYNAKIAEMQNQASLDMGQEVAEKKAMGLRAIMTPEGYKFVPPERTWYTKLKEGYTSVVGKILGSKPAQKIITSPQGLATTTSLMKGIQAAPSREELNLQLKQIPGQIKQYAIQNVPRDVSLPEYKYQTGMDAVQQYIPTVSKAERDIQVRRGLEDIKRLEKWYEQSRTKKIVGFPTAFVGTGVKYLGKGIGAAGEGFSKYADMQQNYVSAYPIGPTAQIDLATALGRVVQSYKGDVSLEPQVRESFNSGEKQLALLGKIGDVYEQERIINELKKDPNIKVKTSKNIEGELVYSLELSDKAKGLRPGFETKTVDEGFIPWAFRKTTGLLESGTTELAQRALYQVPQGLMEVVPEEQISPEAKAFGKVATFGTELAAFTVIPGYAAARFYGPTAEQLFFKPETFKQYAKENPFEVGMAATFGAAKVLKYARTPEVRWWGPKPGVVRISKQKMILQKQGGKAAFLLEVKSSGGKQAQMPRYKWWLDIAPKKTDIVKVVKPQTVSYFTGGVPAKGIAKQSFNLEADPLKFFRLTKKQSQILAGKGIFLAPGKTFSIGTVYRLREGAGFVNVYKLRTQSDIIRSLQGLGKVAKRSLKVQVGLLPTATDKELIRILQKSKAEVSMGAAQLDKLGRIKSTAKGKVDMFFSYGKQQTARGVQTSMMRPSKEGLYEIEVPGRIQIKKFEGTSALKSLTQAKPRASGKFPKVGEQTIIYGKKVKFVQSFKEGARFMEPAKIIKTPLWKHGLSKKPTTELIKEKLRRIFVNKKGQMSFDTSLNFEKKKPSDTIFRFDKGKDFIKKVPPIKKNVPLFSIEEVEKVIRENNPQKFFRVPKTLSGLGSAIGKTIRIPSLVKPSYKIADISQGLWIPRVSARLFESPIERTKVIGVSKLSISPLEIEISKSIQKGATKTLQKGLVITVAKQLPKEITKQISRQLQKAIPRQVPRVVQRLVPRVITTTTLKAPPKVPIKFPVVKPIPFGTSKTVPKRKTKPGKPFDFAYVPMVKRKGKYVTVGKPSTKFLAISTGARITLGEAAASFKVVPTGKKIPLRPKRPIPLLREFRTYKISKGRRVPLKDEFIQLRTKRIISPGEKREITFKGLKSIGKFR